MRTAINIAPFVQPDRTTLFRYTVEFKGHLSINEAARRAEQIIRASSRLDHTERGYLLNCMEIGNYEHDLT